MSQEIQTKLNDIAYVCHSSSQSIEACGYHQSRVTCDFAAIEEDLLQSKDNSLHQFIQTSPASIKLAKLFCQKDLPAGSWYLVKEQRNWFKSRLTSLLIDHPQDIPFKIMIAGVASYVHAMGQLLIYTEVLNTLNKPLKIEVTFVDRCDFPLQQIQALIAVIDEQKFFRYKFNLAGNTYKCPKELTNRVRARKEEFLNLIIKYQTGDLTNGTLFPALQFDMISEHFMTSLLYKKFDVIKPIRANYALWLKNNGRLLCADGLRVDSEVYQEYITLNKDANLVNDANATEAVWDPYGMPEETFQAMLESDKSERYAVILDNTLSEFIKS